MILSRCRVLRRMRFLLAYGSPQPESCSCPLRNQSMIGAETIEARRAYPSASG